MRALFIEETEDTPKVMLDPANNQFEISGRSLPEDVMSFYQPVLEWLNEMEQDQINQMELAIKLEYFNTASSKLLLDILLKLNDINNNGKSTSVKWYYNELDQDLEEAGEEYSELVDLPFELVTY